MDKTMKLIKCEILFKQLYVQPMKDKRWSEGAVAEPAVESFMWWQNNPNDLLGLLTVFSD